MYKKYKIRFHKSYWVLFFIIIHILLPTASADSLKISDLTTNYNFSIYKDAPPDQNLESILASNASENFKHTEAILNETINDRSTNWVLIEPTKEVNDSMYLMVNNIGINNRDSVSMFVVSRDGEKTIKTKEKRLRYHIFPVFKLPTTLSKSSLIALKFNNISSYKLNIPISIVNEKQLHSMSKNEFVFFGGLFFGMIILAIYNLLLYVAFKDSSYLTLSGILFSSTLLISRSTTIIPFLDFLKEDEFFYYPLPLIATIIAILMFWKNLLNLKKYTPLLNKILNIVIISNLVIMPVMGFVPHYEYIVQIQLFLLMILLPVATIFIIYKGNPMAWFFIVLISALILTNMPIVLGGLGILVTGSLYIKLYLLGFLLFGILISLIQTAHTYALRRQAERSEADNQIKDEFLRTVNHELRTPMHAVVSAGELLQFTDLSGKQPLYVEKLITSSQHMLSMIDGILNLARIEMNAQPLEKKPFNLGVILSQTQILLNDAAKNKSVDLTIEDQSQLGEQTQLIGDQTSLKQILINLIQNAINFTEKGEVKVIINTVRRGSSDADITLKFSVTDTGIGISALQQEKLFQPFQRISNRQTESVKGSGLGLSISQKLVRLMGGNLELTSKPNIGSCFFFTLTFPLSELADHKEVRNTKTPTLPIRKNKIQTEHSIYLLIVDDSELNCFFTQELLKFYGYTSKIASNGFDALRYLKEEPFDLVLLDINMPEMDGYELTRRIRSNKKMAEMPIIALTANSSEQEKERCHHAGIDDCLSKPFNLEELDGIIQSRFTV